MTVQAAQAAHVELHMLKLPPPCPGIEHCLLRPPPPFTAQPGHTLAASAKAIGVEAIGEGYAPRQNPGLGPLARAQAVHPGRMCAFTGQTPPPLPPSCTCCVLQRQHAAAHQLVRAKAHTGHWDQAEGGSPQAPANLCACTRTHTHACT